MNDTIGCHDVRCDNVRLINHDCTVHDHDVNRSTLNRRCFSKLNNVSCSYFASDNVVRQHGDQLILVLWFE